MKVDLRTIDGRLLEQGVRAFLCGFYTLAPESRPLLLLDGVQTCSVGAIDSETGEYYVDSSCVSACKDLDIDANAVLTNLLLMRSIEDGIPTPVVSQDEFDQDDRKYLYADIGAVYEAVQDLIKKG